MVSRLCYGTLTIGPLQARLSLAEGSALLEAAYQQGVTFFDSAESYGTYPYLKELIRKVGRHNIVLTGKSYAADATEARQAVYAALEALGTDYIDIFLLHEQLSESSLRGHAEALQAYVELKQQGVLRAVGLSTHHIAAVQASILRSEIDVLHPLYNMQGYGIQDGSAAHMLAAIRENVDMGKGVYAMKVLGGGHLIPSYSEAFDHVLGIDCFTSIAVGMQSLQEIAVNTALFTHEDPSPSDIRWLAQQPRKLHIEDYCQACGRCVAVCPTGALRIDHGKLHVRYDTCFTCGYCGKVCPHMALKVL